VRHALGAILIPLSFVARSAAEVPGALVVFEVPLAPSAGLVPKAAPARFVLLADGRAFVGGSSDVEFVQLGKAALDALTKDIAAVRQQPKGKRAAPFPWLTGSSAVSFGTGEQRGRVSFAADAEAKLPPLTLETSGDPRTAPPPLRPLADLVDKLQSYYHRDLRPYQPTEYRLSVTAGSLNGGCRPAGSLQGHLAAAASKPVAVPASAAQGWPHGATAAVVCGEGKRTIVTLRPLLPGEM
jgi:hypothetical protein